MAMVPMANSFSQKLQIVSDLTEAAKVVNTIVDHAQSLGYDDAARFAIRLAMDEALANAIKHGNANDPTRMVDIDYAIDSTRVTISICDEGCGFNPAAVPDPTLDENIERPHGRGVMLMKAYMTSVEYNPQGNCVVMSRDRVIQAPKSASR
jgi:serine/threonine-protein kinase RsbW